jgi:signal transduction histidine kinase
MIEEPDFLEGKIFYKTIKKISKSMHDEIHKYKKDNIDYKEYIEMWVHEVKTPLSAGKLRARNIDSLDFSGIQESLDEIDHYVEQVLYYAKSSRANEDYIIKSNNLEEIVNESIKKNSLELIKSKVKIIKESLDYNVYTDKKWTLFIINQIIYNSIKYMNKEEKLLTFKGSIEDDNIKLSIIDNGIGISQKDINKVFKKGFTGKNGRLQIKSTGIGLYLCKKLCDKLGMQIKIYSKENKYTQVALFFPKSRATF